MYSTYHNEILHTSWQLHCRDVCKISLWSVAYILQWSTPNFGRISNLIEISLLGRAPDQRKDECYASLAFVRGIHRWPVGELPAQIASNSKNVSIWWCHHDHKRPASATPVPRDCNAGQVTASLILYNKIAIKGANMSNKWCSWCHNCHHNNMLRMGVTEQISVFC